MRHDNLTVLYGPPGTGKTTRLIEIVEKEIESGVDPARIGYLAFTKKAAGEAMERACKKFSFTPEQLPFFRTIHSLAFRQLGLKREDVMQWQHYKDIGSRLGITLRPRGKQTDDWYGMDTGDRIMFLEGLSRAKRIPLEQVVKEANEVNIPNRQLFAYAKALAEYKSKRHLLDYADMLDRFCESQFAAPKLDVLIVDEGQDLSRPQWDCIQHAATHTKRVYVAGDDLQAVYSWSGADVDSFLNLVGTKHTLEQSYRIPASVHRIAEQISRRVRRKSEQVYRPRAEEGIVRRYSEPDRVDLSQGTWYLLARNGYMLKQLEDMCLNRGFSFTSVDKSPLDSLSLKAIIAWEQMRKGRTITKAQATNLFKFISTERMPQEHRTAVSKLGEDAEITLIEADAPIWHKALDKISPAEREYFIAARKRGETLTGTPRIRISTIHASKGGESDHVMLLTDMSERTEVEMHRNPDPEHRTWYVGVTRAKHGLHIIRPQSEMSYQI